MATLKEIAEKANVSIGTVDRVVHNRGRVAEKTRLIVEKIVKELNYQPNLFARQLKLSKKYKFAVLMPGKNQDSNYWRRPEIGITRAENELKSHNIETDIYHFDRYSEKSFINHYQKMLNETYDGLLISPVLRIPALKLSRLIPEHIPYIFFDSDLPETRRLCFIGQDPYKSGRLAGKLMNMMVDCVGTIAALRIMPEDYHIDQRLAGFQKYFEKIECRNQIKIYQWQEQENIENLKSLVEKICIDNNDLRGIFASNALTYPVANYLLQNNLRNRIKLIGYDLIEENVSCLKKNGIDFLISQSPVLQGYQGIHSLYRFLVLDQNVEDKIWMPIDIVTQENIDYYRFSLKIDG